MQQQHPCLGSTHPFTLSSFAILQTSWVFPQHLVCVYVFDCKNNKFIVYSGEKQIQDPPHSAFPAALLRALNCVIIQCILSLAGRHCQAKYCWLPPCLHRSLYQCQQYRCSSTIPVLRLVGRYSKHNCQKVVAKMDRKILACNCKPLFSLQSGTRSLKEYTLMELLVVSA